MNARAIRDAISPVIFLVAVVGLVALALGLLDGCAKTDTLPIENALAVKQYDDALVECQQAARQKPKELRFEAYADCEQNVTKFFCDASQELRETWDRCKELSR